MIRDIVQTIGLKMNPPPPKKKNKKYDQNRKNLKSNYGKRNIEQVDK